MKKGEKIPLYSILANIIDKITSWEKKTNKLTSEDFLSQKEKTFLSLREQINTATLRLSSTEKLMIDELTILVAFKNKIGSINKTYAKCLKNQSLKNIYIGFMGPLGVGKSTVAKILIRDLRANYVVKEPYEKNPYWIKSQRNKKFMLNSQLYFLLSNIFSDLQAKLQSGISVSDTNVLTDILMWVPWYERIGYMSRKEFQVYKRLVELLKPIIPRPDLLVALVPQNAHQLYQGIRLRCQDQPQRKGELNFTKSDLATQIKNIYKIIPKIEEDWKVKTLSLQINPLEVKNNHVVNNDYVFKIKQELNLLFPL